MGEERADGGGEAAEGEEEEAEEEIKGGEGRKEEEKEEEAAQEKEKEEEEKERYFAGVTIYVYNLGWVYFSLGWSPFLVPGDGPPSCLVVKVIRIDRMIQYLADDEEDLEPAPPPPEVIQHKGTYDAHKHK